MNNTLLLTEYTWEIVIDQIKVVCYVTEIDGRMHCGKTHITHPFTIQFNSQRDGKMSGEIKFKGHPCLTFKGKSWIQKSFYLNLVAILNISQTNEPKTDNMGGDTAPVPDSVVNDN